MNVAAMRLRMRTGVEARRRDELEHADRAASHACALLLDGDVRGAYVFAERAARILRGVYVQT